MMCYDNWWYIGARSAGTSLLIVVRLLLLLLLNSMQDITNTFTCDLPTNIYVLAK